MRTRLLALALAAAPASAGPVLVVVDMDAQRPGIQASVRVEPGTTVVPGVRVIIYDPEGTRSVQSIGYLGGLDRGISFGHMPLNGNQGQVVSLNAALGSTVNPASLAIVFPAMDRAFDGPEVQYVEFNAPAPAIIQSTPAAAIFAADIHLSGAAAGDVFEFYILDFVSVWTGGAHGAFTTGVGLQLDTGGDAVPDLTRTLMGFDPDAPVPVPPAAYPVDFVDGGPGPATVMVLCYPDCNADGLLNLADFGCFQTKFALGDPYADCNGDALLNLADFGCFQSKFAIACP